MKNAYYFISDVHLGYGPKEDNVLKENILLHFLDYIKADAKELFIVGDLFDYWMEYKHVVPKGYYRLFAKIAELVSQGIKINYLAGNHDFWRGTYFKEEFDIDIVFDEIIREIDGRKFFIHHGDGMAYKDTGYKILKKIMRNRFAQFMYAKLHPDWGLGLAKQSSHSSRMHTGQKDYTKHDGLRDFGELKIKEGFDFVIMGHRHRPLRVDYPTGTYINTGDWIDNFTYVVYKDKKIELISYYNKKENKYKQEIIKAVG